MKKFITLLILFVGMVSTVSADNYLKGSWDSWNATAHKFVFDSNGYGTVTISNLAASTTYEFVIQDGETAWSYNGDADQITNSNCKNWTLYTGNANSKITTSVAGDYTFKMKWIDSKPHLWVIYPTSETYVVHFKKGNGWGSVWAYRFFNGSDVCDVKWHGTELTANSNNSGYYDVTFSDAFDRITFTDNGSDSNKSGDVVVNFSYPETWVTNNASIQTTAPDDWIGYTRSVTSGNFGTICLPFAATVTGATVFKIVSTVGSGEGLTGINLESVDALEAGKAYIFKATSSTLTATYSGSYTAATAGYGMMGNISSTPVVLDGSEGYYVVGADNKIHKVVSGGSGVTVGQYKGYITLTDIKPVSARGMDFLAFEDGGTTAIETVKAAQKANNEYFNLAGQRVAQPVKGLYIVNGKKVIIK